MLVDFNVVRNYRIYLSLRGSEAFRPVTVKPVVEQVTPCDGKDTSWQMCEKIRLQLRNQLTGDESNSIQFSYGRVDGTNSTIRCSLDGPLISALVHDLGPTTKITASLSNIISGYGKVDDLTLVCSAMVPRCNYHGNKELPMFEGTFDVASFNPTVERWSADLTIRVFGTLLRPLPDQVDGADKAATGNYAGDFNKRILSEQYQTDVGIVTVTGKTIRCHKLFLTGNSSVFERMLHDQSFVEGQTNTIVVDDMSDAGVQNLLNFLYYGDLESAQKDFDLCLELLEASEKYGIEKLQERMKRLLLGKQYDWFTVKGSLRLFCFARCAEKCLDLKSLAARVLKMKYGELQDSVEFKKLLQTNAEAATDLFVSVAGSLS